MTRLVASTSSAVIGAVMLGACGATLPAPAHVMPAALVPIDAGHNKSHDFARVFCSTLPHLKDKNGHAWGDCGAYLTTAVPAQPQPTVPATYRYLFVGDFGGDCLRGVRAYSTSIAHLRDAHQVSIEAFAVAPFAPSAENGGSIARHIDEAWTADPHRRFVLIGYGKGAADLLEALRALDAAKTKVAALVTIAGDVGGTWLPDAVRGLVQPSQPWMGIDCPGNVEAGVFSLARDVRQRFLREHPPEVAGYSIVAESTLEETSSALRPSWRRLSAYSAEQDGLFTSWETVLPGGKYLGAARADHWAIALPFEESATAPKAADRNHFPRDAVLEAIVRYVAADLAAAEPPGR